jgi:hypothetical protein
MAARQKQFRLFEGTRESISSLPLFAKGALSLETSFGVTSVGKYNAPWGLVLSGLVPSILDVFMGGVLCTLSAWVMG